MATTTIRAEASNRLEQFNLDLLGLDVDSVVVDGEQADFGRRWAHELVITPAHPVRKAAVFTVSVTYHGKPGNDPEAQFQSGWFDARTRGAGFIAGEPHSCTVWYPCNDHPTDKARFWLTATVPRPFEVVSNGVEGATTSGDRQGVAVRTFRWHLRERTATYLTTIYIDDLTIKRSQLGDGTPVTDAYGPGQSVARREEAKLPEVLRVLSRRWGPYPAPAAGGIFVNGDVPFSLETFTRPLYTEGALVTTIAHENAHQWWGDNVSIKRWRDVCLNECLASYSQWLWDEHQGANLDNRYRKGVKGAPRWLFNGALYDMGPRHEFEFPVYIKGRYFVHALRNKIGDHRFFEAMKGIQQTRAHGNMSMLELRDALERRTGVELTSFWREWVLQTGVPSRPNLHPGDL